MTNFFQIKKNKTLIKTEVLAGVSTFMSMVYVIFLIPNILTSINDGNTMYNAIFIATCLTACICTLLIGLIAKWPVAIAPGLGLSSFFTYTIMLKLGYSYQIALFLNFIAGLLFIICSVSNLRNKIINAIPESLKVGMSVGIGLFIAFIGLKNGNVIVPNPNTYIGFINFNLETFSSEQISALLTLFGLILLAILKHFKVKASVIITIIFISIISIPLGITNNLDFNNITSLSSMFNDFKEVSLLANINGLFEIIEILKNSPTSIITLVIVVFSLVLSSIFDSLGALFAVSSHESFKTKNKKEGISKSMLCNGIGTIASTSLGTPITSIYLESNVGISEGGKTGLTSVITSLLFLLAILLGPFCSIIPSCATAPSIIYVGVMMLFKIREIKTQDILEIIPVSIAILLIPLTSDIAIGIGLSFISYTILKIFSGKLKEVSPYMYITSLLFSIYFFVI